MLNSTLQFVTRSRAVSYEISIIIPTWNNLELLQNCIKSIHKNSSLPLQIIIFINDGNDGTLQWVKEHTSYDYVHSITNIGICFAINSCRNMIKSELIMYMNDDMYVLPQWDKNLKRTYSMFDHQMWMMSSTMIEPIDTKNPSVVVKNFGQNLSQFDEESLLTTFTSLFRENWRGSTWPPVMMPLSLWDIVGGFSIEFSPGMYSDPDLSRKLYHYGVRHFIGVGDSLVYHFGSKSTKKVAKNPGRVTFFQKWGLSSNVWMNKVLQVGKNYDGPIQELSLSNYDRLRIIWTKIANLIK